MNLIEYLPEFLRDIREYKEIFLSEDAEIERLKDRIEEVLDEVIVNNANSYGIDRYEKIYDIKNNSTNIEERRFAILSKINNKLPFTRVWLENKLNNLVGKGNYVITEDYKNYKIRIDVLAVFKDIAEMLNRDLREQLSANLEVTVNLFQTEECTAYFAGIVHTGDFIEIKQEV